MTKNEEFRDYVLDQLGGLEGLVCKRMFGGYGLYARDVFFAIINKDTLFFTTDADSRKAYEAKGMEPFRPNAKQTIKSYYEVPAEILEDSDELLRWARRAIISQNRER